MITSDYLDQWLGSEITDEQYDDYAEDFWAFSLTVAGLEEYREAYASGEIDLAPFVLAVLAFALPEGSTEALWY